jgi:hypothetical protein
VISYLHTVVQSSFSIFLLSSSSSKHEAKDGMFAGDIELPAPVVEKENKIIFQLKPS